MTERVNTDFYYLTFTSCFLLLTLNVRIRKVLHLHDQELQSALPTVLCRALFQQSQSSFLWGTTEGRSVTLFLSR